MEASIINDEINKQIKGSAIKLLTNLSEWRAVGPQKDRHLTAYRNYENGCDK